MKETKFKQTEIGEVPEDWEVNTLGNAIKREPSLMPRGIVKLLKN